MKANILKPFIPSQTISRIKKNKKERMKIEESGFVFMFPD